MMHWMFGDCGMGLGPGMGIFMPFFGLLIIMAIALLIRAVLGKGRRGDETRAGNESAEEILKKRYAQGEIGEEEFQRMRDHLR